MVSDHPSIARPVRTATSSQVDRRLGRLGLPEPLVIAFVGTLLVLSADTQLLAVIPLLGELQRMASMTSTEAALSLSVTGIAFAASLPISCRLGDMFGIRRLLLLSVSLVVAGDLICALSSSPVPFLIGRTVVGFSAAGPLFYALLRLRSTSARILDRYNAMMTGAVGAGIVLSFLLGGLIVEFGGSARTVLWIMTAIAAFVLLLVWLLIPDSPLRTRVKVDYLGALLIALSLGLIVLGCKEATTWGWASPATLGVLGAGVLLAALWYWWELHATHPLIDLKVVGRREIWPAFVAAGLIAAPANAGCLLISQYVQTPESVAGYGLSGTVLTAGLYLVPQGVIVAFGGAVTAPIIRAIGQRYTAALGGLLMSVFFFWFATGTYGQPWQVLLQGVVMGSGWCLTYTASYSTFLRATRAGEAGMLTGSANAVAAGIVALVPAIITTILVASSVPGTPFPAEENYGHVWFFCAVIGLAVALVSLLIKNTDLDQSHAPNVEVTAAGASGALE
ncbi:MFS transporter [Streptomyces sp. NPDC090106]|uniref:MFS transporter n=1 Tax=Streptomyces sp. NPDC090106 TaxID=3365946 RepID=UPI003829B8C6